MPAVRAGVSRITMKIYTVKAGKLYSAEAVSTAKTYKLPRNNQTSDFAFDYAQVIRKAEHPDVCPTSEAAWNYYLRRLRSEIARLEGALRLAQAMLSEGEEAALQSCES